MPLLDWEKTLTCPYNPAHQITQQKMQKHLLKCRRNHLNSDVVICQYNASHHIPKSEEQHHLETCPDRKIFELAMYNSTEKKLTYTPPVVSQNAVSLDIDAENWELEAEGHVPYDPQKKCEKSKVLRKIQGATPSERKKFYAAEKIRHENLKTVAQFEIREMEKEKEEVKKKEMEEEEKKKKEEEEKEKEKRPRLSRASHEPLRRPTVEGKLSRQGSITSRLLSLVPDTPEGNRRPASIIHRGRIEAIPDAEETVISNGTLNARLGRLALGGGGKVETMNGFRK